MTATSSHHTLDIIGNRTKMRFTTGNITVTIMTNVNADTNSLDISLFPIPPNHLEQMGYNDTSMHLVSWEEAGLAESNLLNASNDLTSATTSTFGDETKFSGSPLGHLTTDVFHSSTVIRNGSQSPLENTTVSFHFTEHQKNITSNQVAEANVLYSTPSLATSEPSQSIDSNSGSKPPVSIDLTEIELRSQSSSESTPIENTAIQSSAKSPNTGKTTTSRTPYDTHFDMVITASDAINKRSTTSPAILNILESISIAETDSASLIVTDEPFTESQSSAPLTANSDVTAIEPSKRPPEITSWDAAYNGDDVVDLDSEEQFAGGFWEHDESHGNENISAAQRSHPDYQSDKIGLKKTASTGTLMPLSPYIKNFAR